MLLWQTDFLYHASVTDRPSLFSTVSLQISTSYSITVSFAVWAPNNGGGDPPSHYRVQYSRDSNGPWNDGQIVTHRAGVNPYTLILSPLLAGHVYYVRVVPFIVITSYGQINGNPTVVAGPIFLPARTTSTTATPTTAHTTSESICFRIALSHKCDDDLR